MIRKPMKAPSESASVDALAELLKKAPMACSAKLDGIRGVITPKGVLSNSMKMLGNEFMQEQLSGPQLHGLDGELVVGLPHNDLNDPNDDVFNRTTGAIRRSSGEPDFKFYVFDDFTHKDMSYQDRWLQDLHSGNFDFNNDRVVLLEQRICRTLEEALAFEEELVALGYEGMMARSIMSPYKEGRATMNQGYIIKRKPLEQRECVIVDAFEQLENQNEKFENEMGDNVRSSHQENKIGKDTLGGFIVSCSKFGEFSIGTFKGGTKEWRQKIWDQYKADPYSIIGQMLTYKYQAVGSIDKPRQPRAHAEFRMPEDLPEQG